MYVGIVHFFPFHAIGKGKKNELAEKEGFEPSVRFRTHDFQSCTFGLSVTSPHEPVCKDEHCTNKVRIWKGEKLPSS